MSADFHTLKKLQQKVGDRLSFQIDGERCVALNLTSVDCPYSGLIRHHSLVEKQEILSLICLLTGLKQLNLRRNKIYHLPKAFRDLRELEVLNLGSNSLGEIPPELSSLNQLKHLHLGNNDIRVVPGFIDNLVELEYLALHKNIRLKSINALIGLSKLKNLNLHYLNLHRLPHFIYEMKNLVSLTVWNISQFADELENLSNLEFFSDCGSPGLRTLPQALTKLKKMRMMRLFQNNLESLPDDFGDLENLEQVSFYQNGLSRLPESFARLKKLAKLNLGWNRFKFVPECLSECTALRWLAIFENPLKHTDALSLPRRAQVVRVWPFTTIPENNPLQAL